jgi:hypothetical protein
MKEIHNLFYCRICNNMNKIQSNFTKSKKLICNNCENIFYYELFFCKKCNKSTYCIKIEPDINYKIGQDINYKIGQDINYKIGQDINYKIGQDINYKKEPYIRLTEYKSDFNYNRYICICNEIYNIENREIYQSNCCNIS